MQIIKVTITAVISVLLLLTIALGCNAIVSPIGYAVECMGTSFTMPAGSLDDAQNAAKAHQGCIITKMQF